MRLTKIKNTTENKTENMGTFTQAFWYFLGDQKLNFIVGLVLFGLAQVFMYAYFNQIAVFINFVNVHKESSDIIEATKLIALLGFYLIISGLIRIFAKERISRIKIINESNIKKEGMLKLMEFPIEWHQKENSGNKVQRLNEGAANFAQLINGLNNVVLAATINIIITMVIFIRINIWYLFFVIAFTIVMYINQKIFLNLKDKYFKERIKLKEVNAGLQYETASNILTAKANDAVSRINTRLDTAEDKIVDVNLKIRRLVAIQWYITHTIGGITIAIFMFLVFKDYVSGALLIGNLAVMLTYYKNLRDAIFEILTSFDTIEENMYAINRMYPIFTEQPEVYFGIDKFPIIWNQIIIDNAQFSYPNQEKSAQAIENLNLVINKFDKIGVVGHSGSGKSTLAKLLIGLYKLESGDFKIGSSNYYDISHRQITDNISIVLQETELFNMSFKENITLLKDFDEVRFCKALKISQLTDILESLPQGLETKVGEKGYKLSGGQKQRVGIARAIYSDAPIIIFDEATSALDTKTERLIQDALDNELEDKTMLFIAHRLSTLKNMDRIIVFENGKIIEDGEFQPLLNKEDSVFGELWNAQSKLASNIIKN